MRNRENIEVLILEAKISFIDKRLLFNRKKKKYNNTEKKDKRKS